MKKLSEMLLETTNFKKIPKKYSKTWELITSFDELKSGDEIKLLWNKMGFKNALTHQGTLNGKILDTHCTRRSIPSDEPKVWLEILCLKTGLRVYMLKSVALASNTKQTMIRRIIN